MASISGSIDPSSSLAVLIDTIVKSFKPLYTTLIVACIWSAMLVPLFVVLLFFSNKELRRKPVFFGNIFAICLGIVLAGLVVGLLMSVLLNPLVPPSRPLYVTFATFMAFSPLLVESVLLIRVWAVFPFRTTPRLTFFAIFTVIVLLKIARVSNAIVYLVNLTNRVNDDENTLLLLQHTWTQFPNYKIEWFLQVAENTITSALFLFKLNRGRGIGTRMAGSHWSSTLEALFWIALSNFVIPVILSIVELIVIWLSTDIFNVVPIFLVNLYVEIIGVLLATVWAAGTTWQDNHKSSRSGPQVFTTVNMDTGTDAPTSRNNSGQDK
ncbi:hypothetical protein M378DRAFT_81661 [Amanita muscaria Koide BX008]|uniref:Uncharacterized protein n=1 Tax=Amanita muscaria (strain Koide BX008) TaxID=946122 RepID=A0A0C2T6B6_AMAMK|nr:hypothetical protein M378DRAFT_81661 [Amanita muscaria Koide BX008]